MSHSQGNDKIYEELRGYFPPEYDLTPDELEKEIEIENKKREIALGMMRAHLTEEQNEKSAPFTPKSKILNVSRAKISEPRPAQADKATETTVLGADDEASREPAASEETFVTVLMQDEPDEAETDTLPESDAEAGVVSESAIYAQASAPDTEIELDDGGDIGTLDELFYELENEAEADEAEEKNTATNGSLRKSISWFFDFLEVFAICITCIIVIFAIFFRLTKVSGESMENTLLDGQYLVVSDLFYEPECGDIVVIQNTALENELLKEPLVKRVIATGGQSVDIALNGTVVVTDTDGTTHVLDQSYIKDDPYAGTSGHFDVPEGYVFVMGDNRNHSTDSRSPMVGVVDERCIFGKAIIRLLPFADFTVFENPYNK